MVPKDLLDEFFDISLSPSIRQVWAANNTPIRINGEIRLPFFLNARCVWTTALVSEDEEEVMFRIDWLEECVWDFKPEICTLTANRSQPPPAADISDADGCCPSHTMRYLRDLRKM